MHPFCERYEQTFQQAERALGRAAPRPQVRLFTQALFNRLLFLRFVELKHWLEFQGRFDYLRALWAAGGGRGRSIYRSRIVPLFRALAGEAPLRPEVIGKVPVLAGGPFSLGDLDRQIGDVPDAVLDSLLGERGLFYDFRFTIDETDSGGRPDVVDPQMLGTVFEELVTGRNESGAYYTPRPVVSFMCREALKCHLSATTSLRATLIQRFVDDRTTRGFSASAAREIDAALCNLRAIDPACGSGAYLVGLLGELADLRRLLSRVGSLRRNFSRYEAKRQIIGANLFGIDLDPLATRIARLRLWLSLAVDAVNPFAFPELDGKIVTGNAVIGEWPEGLLEGGYDVVLANPPYVRHERIGGATKRFLQRRYPTAVDGKSDLYCSFFARGLELLRDGGVQVCISSGSWLDVGFGAKLQRHLLSEGRIDAVYDSVVERQFAPAAINTVISVIRKDVPADDSLTRFVTLRAPLERALRDPAARRELLVSREDLWNPPGSAPSDANGASVYRGGKWSGRYLRAPDSFVELMRNPGILKRLEDHDLWSIGRGRRTGCDDFFYLSADQVHDWNIEPEFLKPLVKSPLQFRATVPRTAQLGRGWRVFLCHQDRSALRGTCALRYIRYGERLGVSQRSLTRCEDRWYDLGRQPAPDLIVPIAFHERFFVILNDAGAQTHQRFATITLEHSTRPVALAVAALLSSSLVVLLAEVLGRHGLGQGALDFPPDDWREMLIPDVARIPAAALAELADCWTRLATRPPMPFSEAIDDPAQRRLDGVVARLIGRGEPFLEAVRRDALALVHARLAKSRARPAGA